MSRKIAILGMGATAFERKLDMWRYVEGYEVWTLNNGYQFYENSNLKIDRIFELHKYEYLKTWNPGHSECHFSKLNQLNCDVYTSMQLPVIERQSRFPHMDLFRSMKTNYFLGSPSLMLALALYEHDNGNEIEEIISYGIDTSDPSHCQQRHSWAFWIGKGIDRGIKFGGTATEFMAEHENDDGLRGLREEIGSALCKEGQKQIDTIENVPESETITTENTL